MRKKKKEKEKKKGKKRKEEERRRQEKWPSDSPRRCAILGGAEGRFWLGQAHSVSE